MTKKEKKQIISLIKEIKNFLRRHENWRCYSMTKPHNSYSYYELTARWFRKQKYKVELGYGTLPSERNCYITIYKKNKTMTTKERVIKRLNKGFGFNIPFDAH